MAEENHEIKAQEVTFAIQFLDRYGSYAFGIASLLLIWFTIVAPEMQRNRLAFEDQQKVVEQMNQIVVAQQKLADTLAHLVQDLERFHDGLEKQSSTKK